MSEPLYLKAGTVTEQAEKTEEELIKTAETLSNKIKMALEFMDGCTSEDSTSYWRMVVEGLEGELWHVLDKLQKFGWYHGGTFDE